MSHYVCNNQKPPEEQSENLVSSGGLLISQAIRCPLLDQDLTSVDDVKSLARFLNPNTCQGVDA